MNRLNGTQVVGSDCARSARDPTLACARLEFAEPRPRHAYSLDGDGDRRRSEAAPAPRAARERAGVAGRRLLVLAPQPFYEDRGTPIALAHVLGSLARLGVRAEVVTFPVGEDVRLPGIAIIRAGPSYGIRSVPVGLSARKLLFDVALVARAAAQLRQARYDALYAIEETVLPALLLGRACGLPVIYDMQSSMPEQLLAKRVFRASAVQAAMRRIERWFVRRASVVACSAGLEGMVRGLAAHAMVEAWRYPGARAPTPAAELLALRDRLRIPRDAPVVYYGGTFENYQGVESLVAAMPRVLERVPRAVFLLVGATASSADVRPPAGVPSTAFRLVPRLPRESAARLLALADVAVSPRASGLNLPLKIIDYLCAGKAIVATDHPAHRTVLDESRARLVSPDARSIAGGIADLLLDPARAAELASAAHAYAARRFAVAEFDAQVARILVGAFACPRGGARLARGARP